MHSLPGGLRPRSPARDDGPPRWGFAGVQEGAARAAREREGVPERRPVENQPRSL